MAEKKDRRAQLEKQMVPFSQRLPALLRLQFAELAEQRGLAQVELLTAAIQTLLDLDAKIQELPPAKRAALEESARAQAVSIYESALERAKLG